MLDYMSQYDILICYVPVNKDHTRVVYVAHGSLPLDAYAYALTLKDS